jgi:hypothetical protein
MVMIDYVCAESTENSADNTSRPRFGVPPGTYVNLAFIPAYVMLPPKEL